MTREKANEKRPNPDFMADRGCRMNCTACVVSYEARLRGYDVEAMSYTNNTKLNLLAHTPALAWLDHKTKTTPCFIRLNIDTSEQLKERLEQEIKNNGRYLFHHSWKECDSWHIISADRDEKNILRLYDPQDGKTYTGGYIDNYLNEVGNAEFLRIDDKLFNLDIVDHVLRKARP